MKLNKDLITKKLNKLDQEIHELVDYMDLKIDLKDWHAVMDAAADIRELESKKEEWVGILRGI